MKETSLTIHVSKTVQEKQYEPFTVDMAMTVEPEEGQPFTTKELKNAYDRLETRVDYIINMRLNRATQDPLYGN